MDEVTVGLGLGDLSWDLVGEVHALKVNENVSHFYVFPLDDREGLPEHFFGEGTLDHPVVGGSCSCGFLFEEFFNRGFWATAVFLDRVSEALDDFFKVFGGRFLSE